MFLGRGDFVAFDEAWYLLLGQSLWSGDGYRLTGLRHATLSPLFPILAGAVERVIGSPVWAGRAVAAVTGGLVVLPCWSIFRRLAGRRTALLACLILAVLPSLAAFTVPYWVGWDLWMGPEPVFHLFLYTGIALVLRAGAKGAVSTWAWAGIAFALAYLARPEAIVIAGLVGFAAVGAAAARRAVRAALGPAILFVGFGLAGAPYWLYLHDVLDRWTITGRHVEVPAIASEDRTGPPGGAGGAVSIERMLWQGDDEDYARTLYGLHPSGTRMASSYWGVWPESVAAPVSADSVSRTVATPAPPGDTEPRPHRVGLYVRSLGIVVPGFVWPFIFVGGLVSRRRAGTRVWLVALPLLVASAMIARWVAVDPRTQLFLAPLLAFYAARGVRAVGSWGDRRLRGTSVRRRLVSATLGSAIVGLLFLWNGHRLYSSLREGSPHHLLGAANRELGEALREMVPEDEPVMSWDPSAALYARRDWRVLPYASLPEIVRYAAAVGCEYIVLSRFYPAPPAVRELPENHLVLHVPPAVAASGRWRVEPTGRADGYIAARLEAF